MRLSMLLGMVAIVVAVVFLQPNSNVSAGTGSGSGAEPPDETLLLQQPTLMGEHIVFVYANDLWITSVDGGDARRLTSSPGVERSPSLDPSGRWVAFTGQYEGNSDVYVISVDGGAPRRLTWHPGSDNVQGWHPDGGRVLFTSSRHSGARVARLFEVGLDGDTPKPLPIPRVSHAAYNADATKIAYTPVSDAFRSWKRYRGGRVVPVWIYDTKTHDVEQVPHVNASDTFPCWIAGTVYFASDRSGAMNVWRYRPGSKKVEQVTFFEDFDVRNMSSDGNTLVFEQAGALHLHDPARRSTDRLAIRVRADGLHRLPRWQEARGSVRAGAVSPNGKRAVFEARGEIVTVPREHGNSRNLTNTPGAHDRSPVWSPDGDQIAWFSDASGEYRLLVTDRRGRETPKGYDLGGGGFYHDPEWSPDGEHILFNDKTNRIAYITLETGEVTEVARVQGSLGVIRPSAVWSPDSKWIAFEDRNPRTIYDRVALYELATGEVTRITDDFGAAGSPAFSRDGKHLFFQASVDSGPKRFGLDMSTSAARSMENDLYVVVLQKDGENPLAPKSDEGDDEEEGEEDDEKGKNGKKSKKDEDEEKDQDGDKKDADADSEDAEVAKSEDGDEENGKDEKKKKKDDLPSIDLEGIDQRILALPTGSGRYSNLVCSKKGLLFVDREDGSKLKAFDFDKREAKTIAENVGGVAVSADGKTLLSGGRGGFTLMSESGGDKKKLAIESVKVRVEPEEEWTQILREAWRLQRDYFYDPNMHGIDWPAMWERWSPFLAHVQHRSDLNLLIAEMIGELCCGHQYVSGGETPNAPDGVSVGLLGADFAEENGRFRITGIYRGQNWNTRQRAPLTVPGVDAREGDYLIAVNGRNLTTDENLYAAFENTARTQVEITLSATPDGAEPRVMTVVPIGSEGRLRNSSWVEENRRRVEEASNGRLGYIYLPNTGGSGMAAFDRDFYSQLDKEGLVIDERFNGGGQVADYIIDVLSRKVLCYWMNREQWVSQSPFGTFEGPMVMVINERAGSGGDCLPWLFRREGLGTLVGTRTWGGLVGISGYPPMMDGGRLTAASFGVMDTEGNWAVENVGVPPDVEVIQWPKPIIEDGADPQLDKAIELALESLNGAEPRKRPTYKPPTKR